MPERASQVETVRAGKPLGVGSVSLLPIERVRVCSDRSARGAWFAVAMEPYALVVRDAGGLRAVGPDAEALSLDELREQIRGLDALLASM